MHDVLCAPAVPYADGDTNQSFINYERIEDLGLMLDGVTPQPFAEHWSRINPAEEPIVMPLDYSLDVELRRHHQDPQEV